MRVRFIDARTGLEGRDCRPYRGDGYAPTVAGRVRPSAGRLARRGDEDVDNVRGVDHAQVLLARRHAGPIPGDASGRMLPDPPENSPELSTLVILSLDGVKRRLRNRR